MLLFNASLSTCVLDPTHFCLLEGVPLGILFSSMFSIKTWPSTFKTTSLDFASACGYYPTILLIYIAKNYLQSLPQVCLLHSLNLLESGFNPHHSSKTAPVKVIHDHHVTKSNGQFSVLILLNLLALSDTWSLWNTSHEVLSSLGLQDSSGFFPGGSFFSLCCCFLLSLLNS